MTDFNQGLASQLRAGALQVAEDAEKIVGELTLHQELSVTIKLGMLGQEAEWPQIVIQHAIASRPMTDAMINHKRRTRDNLLREECESAYAAFGIPTVDKMADYLHVTLNTIRRYLSKYGYKVEPGTGIVRKGGGF